MSCKLVVTEPAEKDLEEIIGYISKELSAPQAASDFLDSVMDCYENLENNPLMYEECRNERFKERKYRKAVIKNYLMIYRYDSEINTVFIMRFIYGRRDYINLI